MKTCYQIFRNLVTNIKVVKYFKNFFPKKWKSCYNQRYNNALHHVTKGYKRFRTLVTNCEFVENFQENFWDTLIQFAKQCRSAYKMKIQDKSRKQPSKGVLKIAIFKNLKNFLPELHSDMLGKYSLNIHFAE